MSVGPIATRPPLLPVADAARRLFDMARPVGLETVGLAEAEGRVLRRDLVAARTQPPFDASAMDGFAVRRAEADVGARLRVTGEAAAGGAPPPDLAPGCAVRIFTGAATPLGADAIALQEDVDVSEEDGRLWATIRDPLESQSYIRPAGGDFQQGQPLLKGPRRLSPEDVALAAAAGRPWLHVSRRPRIVLISTGDELALPGEPLGPGMIVASNAYGVAAMLRREGAQVEIAPIASDDPEALTEAVRDAAGVDLIVTLGGASDGAHDHARAAFRAAGAELDFYKIAMRPGKPLAAGRLGAALVLGLPGNPVSAMVCARLFAIPLVGALTGMTPALPKRSSFLLGAPLAQNGPREHYERARLENSAEGARAIPARSQDSSLLSILAAADILIVRPPFDPPKAAGDAVECVILRADSV
ncbi:MAG: molybdopterin molybdotransferase MoeA [Neomegalonema sp.]|nr:molybdopterin molybdotransferase MoeA [Neomegalonema sp.]